MQIMAEAENTPTLTAHIYDPDFVKVPRQALTHKSLARKTRWPIKLISTRPNLVPDKTGQARPV